MENYNVQIQDSEKSWEDVPSKTIAFEDRKDAVHFCYQVSHLLEGKEIRLSTGKFPNQGTYIQM